MTPICVREGLPLGFRAAPKSLYTHDRSRLGISCTDLPGHFGEHPYRHGRAPQEHHIGERHRTAGSAHESRLQWHLFATYRHFMSMGVYFLAFALNCQKWLDFQKLSPASSVMAFGPGLLLGISGSSGCIFGLAGINTSFQHRHGLSPTFLSLALLSRSPAFPIHCPCTLGLAFKPSFSPISALSALTHRFPHLP